ncbi:MAG: clostripain-related cysteine peptidase [Thermoplasmata archaeon]|nr:clostripain-related cysteine peptidase [Thermoplasmata archaeon]
MRSKARFVVATLVAALMALPVAAIGTSAQDARDWTVLMYFGADNDLYQATYFCINQTLKALDQENDPDRVAFVVLFDGPKNGDTVVWDLSSGEKADKTAEALGSGNVERKMTDKATLEEFLEWAIPAYPAEKTMLVLKNGHAWCGICPDGTDNAGDEKILMPINDLRAALENVYGALDGAWIDALVFDGDNMGSIEVAYELRAVTDYFVGSQQQVPLEGLPYYLFTQDLVKTPAMDVEQASIKMVEDYVKYYNNTKGTKPVYDKLLANSQMYVTGAVFRMGENGEKVEAAVKAYDSYLDYMLHGNLPAEVVSEAEAHGIDVAQKLDQWMYPDPTTGELVWAWIPLSRNNISSARDCALIGKINDQQGYEWLPDAYTFLWSISALSNYEAYGDSVPPSADTPLRPPLEELKDPFVRLLLENFMEKFGYVEPGIYRGVWSQENLLEDGALVWVSQSQILDRSGNSFPHGLNIWFPPTWLQWDEDDAWSTLFNKPMTYAYYGIGIWLGIDEVILMPAEYFCIDCPLSYDEIGLDFTADTMWMEFFGVYYDSRWLIYGPGDDTGGRVDSKP